jgi:hypothetical protein
MRASQEVENVPSFLVIGGCVRDETFVDRWGELSILGAECEAGRWSNWTDCSCVLACRQGTRSWMEVLILESRR